MLYQQPSELWEIGNQYIILYHIGLLDLNAQYPMDSSWNKIWSAFFDCQCARELFVNYRLNCLDCVV